MMRALIALASSLLCVACLLTAAPAQAQEEHFPLFGAEIRLGTYDPIISKDPRVTQVREKIYGQQKYPWQKPPAIEIEFDIYPLNEVFNYGLPGAYARVGYWRDTASSRICTDPAVPDPTSPKHIIPCNGTTVETSSKGNDTASITVVPLSLGLIYRFDVLRRNLNFPMIFSAKIGLEYMLWWGATGAGAAHLPNGQQAQGGNLGFSGSISAALSLDYFTAKGAPPQYGEDKIGRYNYLFLEYNLVNGRYLFNNKPVIDLSDLSMVVLGISLDFV